MFKEHRRLHYAAAIEDILNQPNCAAISWYASSVQFGGAMSALDAPRSPILRSVFDGRPGASESRQTAAVIATLGLLKHPEGGYFLETDRDPLRVPNPFASAQADLADSTRSACTSIYYYLTPTNAKGVFHRNQGRTVHTLHHGRGCYVILHADEAEPGQKARVETFIVGHDIHAGERLQWLVPGGKYKASFLLPDTTGSEESNGLLISETVVPGFEFTDHDFLTRDKFEELLPPDQQEKLLWLLRGSDSAPHGS